MESVVQAGDGPGCVRERPVGGDVVDFLAVVLDLSAVIEASEIFGTAQHGIGLFGHDHVVLALDGDVTVLRFAPGQGADTSIWQALSVALPSTQ
jgi:hypothetical protein